MTPRSTTRFDIDDLNLAVAEEWFPVPLTPGKGTARWAKDLAATLATGHEATLLAGHLDDVRVRLMQLKDANMSAAVYLPHANLGVIDCLLTYTVAKTSPKASATAFLREAEAQEGNRAPGMHVHDVKTWRDTTASGALAGARTINTYQELGGEPWTEERVVINVYPPKARQFVQLIFTTSAPDSFSDLPLFATNTAKALTVELSAADATAPKQPHRIASAHPVDGAFGRTLALAKALAVVGVLLVVAAFVTVVAKLVGVTITPPRSEIIFSTTPAILLLLAACCLIPAELLRRGAWSTQETTFMKGGSRAVTLNALSMHAHVAWLTAAFAAWVVLIPLPVLLYTNGWWPATLGYFARLAVWNELAFNGSLAALLCGMSAASLLKKNTYEARAAAGADSIVDGSRSKKFWRWFSHRWRMELTIGGIGAILLGLIPVLGVQEAWVGAGICGLLGLALAGFSVYLCLNSWRSGEDLHRAESVA